MGPLVNHEAVDALGTAVERVREEGGKVLYGGAKLDGPAYTGGHYVAPCIAEANNAISIVQEETFAPILYLISYDSIEESIHIHNDVPQGLSSSIFSTNILMTLMKVDHL